MNIIYQGIDTLAFAVKGALKPHILKRLEEAKQMAILEQRDIPVELGEKRIEALLGYKGGGGFSYFVNTGPLAQLFKFKKNISLNEWNGFVTIRALSFATYGQDKAVESALHNLKDLGFVVTGISLSRADYCMDFLNAPITLKSENFVAHPRVTKSLHFEDKPGDEFSKRAYGRSDIIESITLGKMPGWQVQIYDKRREAIVKKNYSWFKFWGIDRHNPTLTVHRVEIRAGKDELKKYGITTFDDFDAKIGDVMLKAVDAIKYIEPREGIRNISRQPLHPLWVYVRTTVKEHFRDQTSGIEPSKILEVIRESKSKESLKLSMGNIANFAVCEGIPLEEIPERIPEILRENLEEGVNHENSQFRKSYYRSKDRFRFIEPGKSRKIPGNSS